jgi:hypothetical protein
MLDDTMYEVHPDIAATIADANQAAQQMQQPAEPEQAQVQQEAVIPEPQVAQPIETPQQRNFKELRERAERAEREREQLLKLVEQHLPKEQKPQKPTYTKRNLGKDDIVEGKDLDPIEQELREIKEELNHYKQQNTNYSAETRLKAQYPDFDRVCSKENLETFSYAYPELAATLRTSQDIYAMGVSAYTLIKKFNIDQAAGVDMERTEKNLAKPKPTNAINPQKGDNPLSRANAFAEGLTEDLKKQLLREMNEARRGY